MNIAGGIDFSRMNIAGGIDFLRMNIAGGIDFAGGHNHIDYYEC